MKKLTIHLLLLTLGISAAPMFAADGNPPEVMTYQGYLVDVDGIPLGTIADPSDPTKRVSLATNYDVIFRIYNAKQGGDPIWSEQQTVTVDNGYFSVLLGQGAEHGNEPKGKLSEVFRGADISDRFIGITLDLGVSPTEIAPRLKLVSSPFSFTSTQARYLADESGNKNFYKEGAELKIGSGSEPVFTISENGEATSNGKLTADLTGYGPGLQINNGTLTTTLGAENASFFNIQTALPGFVFNKDIIVDGAIRSYNKDAVFGSSNNPDTYLNVESDVDYIRAYAERFYINDRNSYLEINPTADAIDFNTGAAGFYMNKKLNIGGDLAANQVTIRNWLAVEGSDIWLGVNDGRDRGNSVYQRALVHIGSDELHLNFENDFEGGTVIGRSAKVQGDRLDLGMNSNLPQLIMDSTSSGDNWHGQGAQITIGENADTLGSATMNMTYRGDGYGFIGMGKVENAEPSGSYMRFHWLGDNSIYARLRNSNSGFYLANNQGAYNITREDYRIKFNISGPNHVSTTAWRFFSFDGDSNIDFQSDRRFKKNIVGMEPVLSRLMDLQVRRFNWNESDTDRPLDIGVIAQELEPLFPELVSKHYSEELNDDALSVGYTTFGLLSIKGLQELKKKQDAQIVELQVQNDALSSRIESMEKEMEEMKARLANASTQENRIAKLEELMDQIGKIE